MAPSRADAGHNHAINDTGKRVHSMSELKPLLTMNERHRKPQVGIFLSGSGTNAERVLDCLAHLDDPPVAVTALVTDAPETSRAHELGQRFGIPVVASDIRRFYEQHGERRVSIATPSGQEVRQLWTDGLRRLIEPCEFDFAVFAGFVPLTNLTEDFPCLNVHPGDLTYTENGRRLLVGLHTIPIERAILAGLGYLRSSVIIAQAYTGKGGEMDSGPVLGVSGQVPIDLRGHAPEELRDAFAQRPAQRPKGGYADALELVAKANQEALKIHGDWVVLPRVVMDYAAGRYALDQQGLLHYRDGDGDRWLPVETVVYQEDGARQPRVR